MRWYVRRELCGCVLCLSCSAHMTTLCTSGTVEIGALTAADDFFPSSTPGTFYKCPIRGACRASPSPSSLAVGGASGAATTANGTASGVCTPGYTGLLCAVCDAPEYYMKVSEASVLWTLPRKPLTHLHCYYSLLSLASVSPAPALEAARLAL